MFFLTLCVEPCGGWNELWIISINIYKYVNRWNSIVADMEFIEQIAKHQLIKLPSWSIELQSFIQCDNWESIISLSLFLLLRNWLQFLFYKTLKQLYHFSIKKTSIYRFNMTLIILYNVKLVQIYLVVTPSVYCCFFPMDQPQMMWLVNDFWITLWINDGDMMMREFIWMSNDEEIEWKMIAKICKWKVL